MIRESGNKLFPCGIYSWTTRRGKRKEHIWERESRQAERQRKKNAIREKLLGK